ncbi:hypothetical protein [Pseudomonas aeruginosa]|uniref:hypothetical protein n=1 Tax=Pseudomonas aeruginosa TaxID=287 RepID=UPI0011149BAE|nr:hypothetical protein [Pseudomonas aeruginosa]MCV4098580.1 hypothetical protein [Pseudomonas aeruginosa]MDY1070232.1 hypothetical protein [Pseudomonas aeruginosa]MDY1179960.1 hypothetical protein [Pseudomonas aeruginosa]MDY1301465.1 hypothetical protein [Pseudomonas aeruginosa]QGG00131.1 hypothetical protein GFD20_15115 [Pseudomonas aeruginosa]
MKTVSYEFAEKSDSPFSEESPFHINERTHEYAMIFRVLSGSCQVTNLNTEENVELITNYFYSDLRENPTGGLDFLNEFEEGMALPDYEEQINRVGFRNRKFYKSFLAELSSCIYHEHLEKHTAAFVHLYRSYEHLSYAFPMIYASKADDYIGTFESLRQWMSASSSDGNVGELKFHKNFVASLFKGLPELSRTIDIEIKTKQEYRDSIFEALAKKVAGWNSPEKYSPETRYPDKLAIPFIEYHSFLVNLRNRFFHYSNARSDNIGLDDIVEADLLFSFVNKATLNYISTIFHAIVRHQIQSS